MLDALIIGGDGQIGQELYRRLFHEAKSVVRTTRRWPIPVGGLFGSPAHFDLNWPTPLPNARVTFYCTGINGFKPCEADPMKAYHVNVRLPVDHAHKMAQVYPEMRFVFLSSSAAETHPETVYGRCKRAAEAGFLALGDRATAFRFGPVAFPGRNVYPNEIYSPINLSTLIDLLVGCCMKQDADGSRWGIWTPGLRCVYNRDWRPEIEPEMVRA